MYTFSQLRHRATVIMALFGLLTATQIVHADPKSDIAKQAIHYNSIKIENVDMFYREAGDPNAPTLLLLHGFPTSSQMFRNLIPRLADKYHLIAPDYPAFGQSGMPTRDKFAYTFDHIASIVDQFTQAMGLSKYTLYMMDYGGPIGYRLAAAHPERVTALIIQNANAYEEGLRDFWIPLKQYWADNAQTSRDALRQFFTLGATIWQYTTGVTDVSLVSPDAWVTDQYRLDRPGNDEIQLDLFYDYRTNVALYPTWQAYFRSYQPPTLIVWGKNDPIFPAEGAEPFKRDLTDLDYHLLDTGHFALETHGAEIAILIRKFLERHDVK